MQYFFLFAIKTDAPSTCADKGTCAWQEAWFYDCALDPYHTLLPAQEE